MALEFNPQLIMVSAGYDAALGCPEGYKLEICLHRLQVWNNFCLCLGKMNVTPACYGHLMRMLMSVCSRVCVVLEGGYCLESLEESVAMTLSSLLGDPSPPLPSLDQADSCVLNVIFNLTYILQNHWKCFVNFHSFLNYVLEKQRRPKFVPSISGYVGQPIKMNIYPTRNKYLPRDIEETARIKNTIAGIVSSYNLKVANYFVTLGYDKTVQQHYDRCKDSLEGPYRLDAILKKLKRSDVSKSCLMVHGRQATLQELSLVHE